MPVSRKVMISVPEEFLEQLDDLAKAEHRSRSELIREAVRFYAEERAARGRPVDDPGVRAAYERVRAVARTWTEPLDTTALIREMRDARYGSDGTK